MRVTTAEKREQKEQAISKLDKLIQPGTNIWIERQDFGDLNNKRWSCKIIVTKDDGQVIIDISRPIALAIEATFDERRHAIESLSFHRRAQDIQERL